MARRRKRGKKAAMEARNAQRAMVARPLTPRDTLLQRTVGRLGVTVAVVVALIVMMFVIWLAVLLLVALLALFGVGAGFSVKAVLQTWPRRGFIDRNAAYVFAVLGVVVAVSVLVLWRMGRQKREE